VTADMRCPRRDEAPGSDDRFPGPDRYEPQHGLVDQPRGCSYCGSLPPEDFMHAVRFGALLGPTDKSYKVYILSKQTSAMEAKFYFQHLDEAQRREFIDLLNERPRRFGIGYPGHFYTLPFFIKAAS
jgi:hypothetical protein